MDSDEHSNGGTSGTEPSREPVVDAQLHASADLPVETLLELMDAVGVDAAMLVQTISCSSGERGLSGRHGAQARPLSGGRTSTRRYGRRRSIFKGRSGTHRWWTAEPEAIGVRVVILNDYDEARLRHQLLRAGPPGSRGSGRHVVLVQRLTSLIRSTASPRSTHSCVLWSITSGFPHTYR